MAPRKMSYVQVFTATAVTVGIGYFAYKYYAPVVVTPARHRKVAVIMDETITVPSHAKERCDLVLLVNVEENPGVNIAELETKVQDPTCVLKCRKREGIVHMLRMIGVDAIILSEEYVELLPSLKEWAYRVVVFSKERNEWEGKVRYLDEQIWDATIFGTPAKGYLHAKKYLLSK